MKLLQVTSWAFLLAGAVLVHAIVSSDTAQRAAGAAAAMEAQYQAEQKIRRRAEVITSGALIIPVAGVTSQGLVDTWGAARSEGRSHQGIDIMAPAGAQVRAAADGRIAKFFDSDRGGVTIYQFDTSERFVYYYAHLSRRADGLAEGDVVRQGDVIGYVGMTGNAPAPHLHFEIQRLTPERHWWQAESMNPYPLLVAGRSPD